MAILNYTTQIAVEETLSHIQGKLARAGASAIVIEFNADSRVVALSFRLMLNEQPISFKLPARVENIFEILRNDYSVRPKYRTMEQAERTSWRIVKDWVEAQLALVEAEQADLAEVFMPYALTRNGDTVYESLSRDNFALLTGPEHGGNRTR